MRAFRIIGRASVLCLLLLTLLVARAFADSGQVTINDTRVTGFPEVAARFTVSSPRGEPLPVLKDADVVVFENDQPVSSFVLTPLVKSPIPLAMVIAMDASASMNDAGKLPAAKEAAKAFVAQLRPVDQIEIISFGDNVNVVVPFTHDKTALARGIDNLGARGEPIFRDATDRAVNDVLRVSGTRMVVLVTDGQDMVSQAKLAPALDLARQSQVPIYTIGLGNNVQDDVLLRMASETSGHYFKAPRAGDLASVFKQLTMDLANQYELYYFSQLPFVSGKKVDVTVRVRSAAGAPIEGHFSYAMPLVKQVTTAPINPGQLQAVVEDSPPASPRAAPTGFTPELAALTAFGAVLAAFAGLFLRATRDPAEARLAAFVGGAGRSVGLRSAAAQGQLLVALLDALASLATRLLPARQIEQLRRNLVLAGSPYGWGVQEFLGVRMLVAITFAALGYLAGAPRGSVTGLLYGLVLAAIGFLVPVVWLGSKIRSRKRAIYRAMPNALDLIAVTVEAGLGFDQAVGEVCEKWHNELTREFALFLAEMRVGTPRREALRNLCDRTGVPELNGFVGAVIQADELGAGIARTLMVQAEQIRIKVQQDAEKRAHEAAIKMIFPMVFLIFPAIFVVILGPAIPAILESFRSIGH